MPAVRDTHSHLHITRWVQNTVISVMRLFCVFQTHGDSIEAR